jgi:hypothetical protein
MLVDFFLSGKVGENIFGNISFERLVTVVLSPAEIVRDFGMEKGQEILALPIVEPIVKIDEFFLHKLDDMGILPIFDFELLEGIVRGIVYLVEDFHLYFHEGDHLVSKFRFYVKDFFPLKNQLL